MVSIAGSYKIRAIRYSLSKNAPEYDYFATVPACEKDDIIRLSADGTVCYRVAGIVCTPNGSYGSTWSLSGNSITMDGTPGTIQYFDCKTLWYWLQGLLYPVICLP